MTEQTPMTQEQLNAIQARLDAATPGPWGCYGDGAHEVFDAGEYGDGDRGEVVAAVIDRLSDAVFIAHAREDIPGLLAEVERMRALTTVDDAMVERGVRAHRETFNAWPVKRNLEDADNRRVAAMRAALDAALGTGEGA